MHEPRDAHHHGQRPHGPARLSLNAAALRATLHCLVGCSIGEILGLVLGGALRWSNGATFTAAIALAFAFGYGFTIVPLLGDGLGLGRALRIALAADTLSIATMELVDNLVIAVVPGAMDAPVTSATFWLVLLVSLAIAGAATFPINRWLIARGRGHALVHGHHETDERRHAGA